MATKKVNIENICCTLAPVIFFSKNFPIKSPASAPPEKGRAIATFKLPAAKEIIAPPEDTIARTPSEVATIDFIGKSVNLFNAGTIINPPPTPSKPDRNPAPAPANIKERAHGTVHISLPID